MFKRSILSFALGAALATLPAQAAWITLLNENFQGVSGLTGPNVIITLATAGGVSPNTRSFTGDATENSFNIRRWDNPIDGNISTPPNDRTFEDFFNGNPNQFLVIGDNSGGLGGEPNGPATMQVDFTLPPLPPGTLELQVFFRYAFDATSTNNNDDFKVDLVLSSGPPISLLNLTQPVPCISTTSCPAGLTRASLGFYFPPNPLPASSPVALRFFLQENSGNGSSAVGIDDISVLARIPEPASLALLGAGMVGLGWRLKRRR